MTMIKNFRCSKSIFYVGTLCAALTGISMPASAADLVRFSTNAGQSITKLIDVAVAEGYFAEQGITPEIITVPNSITMLAGFAAGSYDIGTGIPEPFLTLVNKGESAKLVVGSSKQILMLAGRPGFNVPTTFPEWVRALKGKKIGIVGLKTSNHYNTIGILRAAGLKEDDVEFVVTGVSPASALGAGVVDAAWTWGAHTVVAKSQGGQIILDMVSKEKCPKELAWLCGISQIGSWAKGSWIDKNPHLLEKVRRAIAKADLFIHDPANAAAAAKYILTDMPKDSSDESKRDFVANALAIITSTFSSEDLASWVKMSVDSGLLEKPISVDKIYDPGTPASQNDVRRYAGK